MIDVAELRDLTVDDLQARAKELEDQLFRMRLQQSLGQLDALGRGKQLAFGAARVTSQHELHFRERTLPPGVDDRGVTLALRLAHLPRRKRRRRKQGHQRHERGGNHGPVPARELPDAIDRAVGPRGGEGRPAEQAARPVAAAHMGALEKLLPVHRRLALPVGALVAIGGNPRLGAATGAGEHQQPRP